MFYLIETKDQLDKLKLKFEPTMYLEFIQGNDNTHPILAEIIAIYLNINNTGYIIPINHLECINWNIDEILDLLKDYNFRVLDKKSSLHAAPQLSYTDIQHTIPPLDKHTTQAHIWYYRKFPQTKVNKMIPIGKHLERCNNKYNDIIGYTQGKTNEYVNNILLPTLQKLEQNGLKINDKFDTYFTTKNKKYSIKENHIYGWYNPYTTTGRPVNNFNGINFVGLKHDNGERDCFTPKNDYFVEMDYDSFHPHLIAKMIGYNFKGYPYNELAKVYFATHITGVEPTPEQYKESKVLTFKQIYGGVFTQYLHHPFFKGIQDYTDKQWDKFQKDGFVVNGLFRKITKENFPDITKYQLFNYLIQAKETGHNFEILKTINGFLKDYKTNVVLYNYDAFVFDFCEDEYDVIFGILKNIVMSDFPISIKRGKHYGALCKV